MIVSIKKLVKRYHNHIILDHFDMDVEKGEILGLTGPAKAGKTMVLNCITGLENFEKGSIKVFDRNVLERDFQRNKKMGIVFQEPAIFEELTVFDNILYFCSLYIKNKKKVYEWSIEATERMGLTDYKKQYPSNLSGGVKRRLDVACSIAHKPELILIDECKEAIDSYSRSIILEEIRKLNNEGVTVIYITHYLEEVEKICTRVAIMDKGRINVCGTKEDLLKQVQAGEKIIVKVYGFDEKKLRGVQNIPDVALARYQNGQLLVKSKQGEKTLLHLLNYLQQQKISFGDVSAEHPTLSDVFLELTGKKPKE